MWRFDREILIISSVIASSMHQSDAPGKARSNAVRVFDSSNVVLCALCHKSVDSFHKTMYVKPEIERYIERNRP